MKCFGTIFGLTSSNFNFSHFALKAMMLASAHHDGRLRKEGIKLFFPSHKRIQNTLVYTQLAKFENNNFVSKVAGNAEEACQLIEAGFEYVCTTPQDIMAFRKRK